MNSEANNPVRHLNEAQWRRFVITCQHIDRLLTEIEAVLHASESKSIFPRIIFGLSATRRKALAEYVAKFRAQMLQALGGGQQITARVEEEHAIHSLLTFIEIALEELRPKDMEGYGPLTEAARDDLRNIVGELTVTAREMQSCLSQDSRPELQAG